MEKQKTNWWIDLILLALFWISFFPDLTGLAVHEWLGAAAMILALWHLVRHWNWVEAVTLRFFSRTSFSARVNYLVDAGVMLGFVMILLTGLLISTWLDLPIRDLAAWTHVHLMVSVFTLLLVVLKLILHWRWVTDAANRHLLHPVFFRAGESAAPRPVNSLDRRDFLKVAGVLGVATAATLHALFDDTQQVQAEPAASASSGAETPQPSATAASAAQESSAAGVSAASESAAVQTLPTPTTAPTIACSVLCPNGCSYPGRCRRYVDRNGNNLCDNGECL